MKNAHTSVLSGGLTSQNLLKIIICNVLITYLLRIGKIARDKNVIIKMFIQRLHILNNRLLNTMEFWPWLTILSVNRRQDNNYV